MKNILIFAFALITLFSACKKDDSIVIPAPVSKKLTGITYENNQFAPESIEYDAQGRISRYVGSEDILTYTYKNNEVVITEWRVTDNREVFSFKGQLNAAGNITKGSGTSSYNAGTNQTVDYTFEYNASGNMVKKTQNINQGTSIYVFDYIFNGSGDMTEVKVYLNGVYSYGGTWEYDNTKKNKFGLNSEQFYGPNAFTGKPNQHMAIKYTGSTGWFVDMVYTYDNQGYPNSNTLKYSDGDTYKLFYTFE